VRIFRLSILFIASILGAVKGGADLITVWREPAPSAFSLDSFPQNYKGQQWLQLTGKLATQKTALGLAGDRTNGNGYAYVPLVSHDWKDGDPIHVIVTFGPWPLGQRMDKVRQLAANGDVTITGQVGPGMDRERVFPGMAVGIPFVWVNDHTAPEGGVFAIGFFLVCVIACALCVIFGVRWIRAEYNG
jgi:hypothetical protein